MRKYIVMLAVMSVAACSTQESIYDFSVQDAEGRQVSLADYKGKVLLIVNTASRCGFTPQYKELEAMYRELNRKGFEILETNFDKNQPGWRENADIKWNFTKFLVDKKGNVVARFEPTATEEQMVPEIMKYLK